MMQDFELNKKRVERLGLTCGLIDDSGKIHHFQDGHEYVEIGGLKWATCNIGAEKETDRGQYFSWGDTQGYIVDQVRYGEKFFGWEDYKYYKYANHMTKYNPTDGKRVLEASDDAARFHMGGRWRMPTVDEYIALCNAVSRDWTTDYQGSGVAGITLTDRTDGSKVLFFPACGLCDRGDVYGIDSFGYYWSSSLCSSHLGRSLGFSRRFCNAINEGYRVDGFSVRGVIG